MNFQEIITKRQSVRSYNGEPVSQEELTAMIKAAQEAPSWKNTQSARYYIAHTADAIKALRKNALPEFNQNSTTGAAAYIISTFKKNISGYVKATGLPENEPANEWGAYDLGLHDMLLCAKATELGLGTLIMGIRNSDSLKDTFMIPDDEEVMSVIAVGHPENLTAKPSRKATEEIVKFF